MNILQILKDLRTITDAQSLHDLIQKLKRTISDSKREKFQ